MKAKFEKHMQYAGRMKFYTLTFSLFSLLLLGSCTKVETDSSMGVPGTELTITVAVDDQFARSAQGASDISTRATDNGYGTTFDDYDAIGIWDGTTNKKWVKQPGGTWKPEGNADRIFYRGTAISLSAYFPHVPLATVLPTAATFTVEADQSSEAAYRKSDLLLTGPQTWNGTPTSIALTFKHAMVMVEAVPSATAGLNSVTLSAARKAGGTPETVSFRPMANNTYRAVLPAQTLSSWLSFNYDDGTVYSYSPKNKILEAGKYYNYKICGIPSNTVTFSMSDLLRDPASAMQFDINLKSLLGAERENGIWSTTSDWHIAEIKDASEGIASIYTKFLSDNPSLMEPLIFSYTFDCDNNTYTSTVTILLTN